MTTTDTLISKLHEIAMREQNWVLAATCLIALGETDSNPAWSVPAEARDRLDAMTRDDAIRQCLAVIDSRDDIEQEYRVAFSRNDGSWDVVETFTAVDDDAANTYAGERYAAQEWYILNASGRNINGGSDQ